MKIPEEVPRASKLQPLPALEIRKHFGTIKTVDLKFCERELWWWRKLEIVLPRRAFDPPNFRAPTSNYSYLVGKHERRGFPGHVFDCLQHFHELGMMPDLIKRWRNIEIAARMGKTSGWPAYGDRSAIRELLRTKSSQKELVTFGPIQISLRKSRSAILRDLGEHVDRLLRAAHKNQRGPNAEIPSRLRYFSASAFSSVEIIDRHHLLGEAIPDEEWARVRGTLRYFTFP